MYQAAKLQAEKVFKYDITTLRDSDSFIINADFIEKIHSHFTVVTSNDKQNEILSHLQKFIAELNYFASIGIVSPSKGIPNGIQRLLQAVNVTPDKTGFRTLPEFSQICLLERYLK